VRRLGAIAACVLVAGCGGSDAPPPGPAPPAVARDVRTMFHAYAAALGREDFAAACTHLTRQSIAALAAQVDKIAPGAHDCTGLLRRLYGPPGSKARRDLGQLVRTLRVRRIDATDRGDGVLLSWSAQVGDRRVAVQQPALRVDGRWQLVADPSLTSAG
jgi:hypothetical protein